MSSQGHSNITFLDDDGNRINNNHLKTHISTIIIDEKPPQNENQLDQSYDPYQHRKVEHPITNLDTIIHLLKSSLGTGILAMPLAFKNAGFLVGTIGTIIIGIVAVYCIQMLLRSHYELCRRHKLPSMDYSTISKTAILEGPQWCHKFAKHIERATNAFILIYQLGICCIYVVFIGANMKSIIDYFCGTDSIDVRTCMVIILIPIICINCVRNLKYLAPFSTLANIITVASFVIICYFIFREPLTLAEKRPVGSISDFPLFFGTVLFSLEAIGVIMPLENEMKTPKSFVGLTGVLNQAFSITVILYVGMGLFGYLRYGDDIKGSITLNLPTDNTVDAILAKSVQGMLAFGIYITHGLACYVAIDLTWNNYIVEKISGNKYKTFWEYVVRISIVMVTFCLAVAIPNLELFISLFGALCLSSLGLAFPAVIETCVFLKDKTGHSKYLMIAKNIVIGLIGLAGFIIGTSTSLKEIIATFSNEHHN